VELVKYQNPTIKLCPTFKEREREREVFACLYIKKEGIPSKLSSYTFIFCGYSIFHMQRKYAGLVLK
jgi:hypothetical protein